MEAPSLGKCCREEREDFLSGTLGFLLPVEGDRGPGKNVAEDEGKVDVGVSDWLE